MRRSVAQPKVQTMLQSAGVPALAIILMGFFVYYAVLGPNGVLAYRDYTRQIDRKQAEFAALEKRRAELRNDVRLLDARRGANPDMVDELVRKELNVAHPDEIIVPLN